MVVLPAGGEGNPAVAKHDGRDAMPARRRPVVHAAKCESERGSAAAAIQWALPRNSHRGIPSDLSVIVGVAVDPAGADKQPRRVNLLRARDIQRRSADRRDQAVLDGHVGDALLAARAVHQRAAADDEVRHPATSLPLRLWALSSAAHAMRSARSRAAQLLSSCSVSPRSATRGVSWKDELLEAVVPEGCTQGLRCVVLAEYSCCAALCRTLWARGVRAGAVPVRIETSLSGTENLETLF